MTNPWDDIVQVKEPTYFRVISFTDTTITFAWKINSDNHTGFDFAYKVANNYVNFASVEGNISSATVPFNRIPLTIYEFKMRAKSKVNYSAYTAPLAETFEPIALVDVELTAVYESGFTIGWGDNKYSVWEKDFYISTDNKEFTYLGNSPANQKFVALSMVLDTHKTYYLRVKLKNGQFHYTTLSYVIASKMRLFVGGYGAFYFPEGRARGFVVYDGTHWEIHDVIGTIKTIVSMGEDIYVGGSYGSCDDKDILRLGRLRGKTWEAIPYVASTIYKMLFIGDQLYVAGYIPFPGNSPSSSFACRWDGNNWNQLSNGSLGDIYCMTVLNNKLIAAGNFENNIYRVNVSQWDGTRWEQLGDVFNFPTPTSIYGLAVYKNEVYVAINYYYTQFTKGTRILRWRNSQWEQVVPDFMGTVYAMQEYKGDLYIGGSFSVPDNPNANNLVKFDGTGISVFGQVAGSVMSMHIFNEALIVGGAFVLSSGGTAINNLAEFNGTWKSMVPDNDACVLTLNSGRMWYLRRE